MPAISLLQYNTYKSPSHRLLHWLSIMYLHTIILMILQGDSLCTCSWHFYYGFQGCWYAEPKLSTGIANIKRYSLTGPLEMGWDEEVFFASRSLIFPHRTASGRGGLPIIKPHSLFHSRGRGRYVWLSKSSPTCSSPIVSVCKDSFIRLAHPATPSSSKSSYWSAICLWWSLFDASQLAFQRCFSRHWLGHPWASLVHFLRGVASRKCHRW